jgi:L-alanine-DL-glutamate epimerase-like enolase superfamily enzyme
MLAEPLRIDAGGCLALPAAPGLGIELDEEVVAWHALEMS